MLEKEIFTGLKTLTCDVLDFKPSEIATGAKPELVNTEEKLILPVFSGYEEYLTTVYGDYKDGLTDEIGCGLTKEEKEELKNHQAKCFEALSFLQELSLEFGLRYYLIAGSVLGAVRHGGFGDDHGHHGGHLVGPRGGQKAHRRHDQPGETG